MKQTSRSRKKCVSLTYQPRKMTLQRNGRHHVLGMSLTHLNISMSYKNRIRALLDNNKALARSAAYMQHELALKEQEILELKKVHCSSQATNSLEIKNKLNALHEHLQVAFGLIKDTLNLFESSSTSPQVEVEDKISSGKSERNSKAKTPFRTESVSALSSGKEEHWVNNLTIIEEQSYIDNSSLPPLCFTEEPKDSCHCNVTSRSTSRSHSAGKLEKQRNSRGSRRSSLYTSCPPEVNCLADNEMHSSQSLATPYTCLPSNLEKRHSEVRHISSFGESPNLPDVSNCLDSVKYSEEPKESYENDIAICIDPILISQAVVPTTEVTDCPSKSRNNELTKVQVDCYKGSTGNPIIDCNKTSHNTEDMELTAPIMSSLGVVLHVDESKLNKGASNIQNKVLEVSMSPESENDDPDYMPQSVKKRIMSLTNKKNVISKKKKVESKETISFKLFSASPKRKKTSTKTKVSKSKKKVQQENEKKDKRDVLEHPSAVFDYSSEETSVFQPYLPFKKPLPVDEHCKKQKTVQLKISTEKDRKVSNPKDHSRDSAEKEEEEEPKLTPKPNSRRKSKRKQSDGVQMSKQQQSDIVQIKENLAPNTLLHSGRRSHLSTNVSPGQITDEAVKRGKSSGCFSNSETGVTPEGTRESRRTARGVVSYREPTLNRKMRRSK